MELLVSVFKYLFHFTGKTGGYQKSAYGFYKTLWSETSNLARAVSLNHQTIWFKPCRIILTVNLAIDMLIEKTISQKIWNQKASAFRHLTGEALKLTINEPIQIRLDLPSLSNLGSSLVLIFLRRLFVYECVH